MDTIRIEMDMPRPPEGWRYTGKFSSPKKGEFYQSPYEIYACRAENDHINSPSPILERVPWEPKPGEMVWGCSNSGPNMFKFEHHMIAWLTFKTESEAAKFYAELHPLADRIRAESEVEHES
jgi:hypothetical protein